MDEPEMNSNSHEIFSFNIWIGLNIIYSNKSK